MRYCKKILALLLCITAIFMLTSVIFASDGHVTGSLSASEVKVGDTFTMTVSINATKLSSMGVEVDVDDDFEIVSGEWLQDGLIASFKMDKQQGAFKPSGTVEMSGDIFKLTLKAKTAGASTKNVSITVIAKNSTTVVFEETATKSVKVSCTTHTFGAYSKNNAEHSRTCTACGYAEKAVHQWNGGSVTTPATCTNEGVKTYTCTTCNHTKTEAIKKLSHTYGKWTKVDDTNHSKSCCCGNTITAKHSWDGGKVTASASCSKEGTKTFACKDCGATKTEAIKKIEHTYTNTCDSSCNACGDIRDTSHKYESKWATDEKNHWHKCSVCGDKADNATHTASDWIVDKEATDLMAGSKHQECTVCQKILKTESISATGCKHGDTKVIGVKDATCEEDGYTGDIVCKICNTVMTPGNAIPATGHDIETTGAKEATCAEEGFSGKQICKTCNKIVDEGTVIEKVTHSFADGVCTVCNAADPDVTQPTEPSIPDETKPTEPSAPGETEPTEPSETTPIDSAEPAPTAGDSPDYTGIVVGVVIVVAAIAALVIALLLKRRR